MPEALISRITSRGPGAGSGNSLSSSFLSPRKTTPFMAASVGSMMNGTAFLDRTRLRDYSPPTWLGHQEFGRIMVPVYELRTYTLIVDGLALKFRPLVAPQEVKLLTAAPWGPHP